MVDKEQICCVILVEDEDDRKQLLGLDDRVYSVFEVKLYGGLDVILTDDTRHSVQILSEEVSLHHPGFILPNELFNLDQTYLQDVSRPLFGYTLIDLHLLDTMIAGFPTWHTVDIPMKGPEFLQQHTQIGSFKTIFLGVDFVVDKKYMGSLLEEFLKVSEFSIRR